ncbi:MAG TPA: SpoIIE family protein phosphatase [Phycisphaerae bacterium]|nr:SpoIIE family protein phosphatase [Phycisphaerae bacterium]
MSIRWKLLILLLTMALVPLVFVAVLDRHGMLSLGRDLAVQARQSLTDRTGEQLQQLIRNQAALVTQQRETLQHLLLAQARAVDRCLAAEPPADAKVYLAEDFDRGDNIPADTKPSSKHYRFLADGPGVPIPVSYSQQAFKLAPGVSPEAVAPEIARLSRMSAEYRFRYQAMSDLIYWQYTATESGVHSSYPGHGGYPAEYDPRQRQWYTLAKERGQLCWIGPYFDASSEQLILTIAAPVHRPDGSFAGVTGLDVTEADIVEHMKLPATWSEAARAILVQLQPAGEEGQFEAAIIAQPGYHRKGERWSTPFDAERLESEDTEEFGRLLADMAQGQWGQRQMPYLGRDCLWVYGPVGDQGGYLVLILPYAEVVAQAAAAGREILDRTGHQLQTDALVAGAVILVVVACAVVGSRSVTRPLRRLAAAADRIAKGDLEARVRIKTGDELGLLGRTFNAMVPQLQDRLRLKQSLALAMEVQQHLLPSGPPQVKGLDVAGQSIYCDETGGDYYDYLDLSELAPGLLGVAIGDVTGHGIAAAMLMTTGRALLRSRAVQPGSLAELMNDMNRCLSGDMSRGRFMTLFYMVIDARSRQVRWASAGHDPAIVFDPETDAFSELEGSGLPLGIEAGWAYRESGPVTLKPGQVVLLGTDGIWESRNPQGDFFGKDALREVIRRNADAPAERISKAVTEVLAQFRKDHAQEDDVTLVVIKVLAT